MSNRLASRVRVFTGNGLSFVRLPATVAFPTDSRLLDRIEERRNALPPNSVKPLRRVVHVHGNTAAR